MGKPERGNLEPPGNVLPATTISYRQWEKTSQDIYWKALPSLGGEYNLPLALRCPPLQYFGLELPQPHEEQGIEHIKIWIQHADYYVVLFNFLHIQLEQC